MGRFVSPIGVRLGISKSWDYTVGYSYSESLKMYNYIDYLKRWFMLRVSKKTGLILSHIDLNESNGVVVVKLYVYPGKILDDLSLFNKSLKSKSIFLKYFIFKRFTLDVSRYIGLIIKYWSEIYWKKKVEVNFYNLYKDDVSAKFISAYLKIQLKRGFVVPELMKYIRKKFERNSAIKGYRVDFSGRFRRKERAEYRRLVAGKLPISTVTSNIDYWYEEVVLKYGVCSIRVWLYKPYYENRYLYQIKI